MYNFDTFILRSANYLLHSLIALVALGVFFGSFEKIVSHSLHQLEFFFIMTSSASESLFAFYPQLSSLLWIATLLRETEFDACRLQGHSGAEPTAQLLNLLHSKMSSA